jgi:charged multivesicular body protein 4A/B
MLVAKMALKRKRAYTVQIEKLQGAKTTLETQIMAIESATTNSVILGSMREGAGALQYLNRNM